MRKKNSAFRQGRIWNFEHLSDSQLINSLLFLFQIVGGYCMPQILKAQIWNQILRNIKNVLPQTGYLVLKRTLKKYILLKVTLRQSLYHFHSIKTLYRLLFNVTIIKSRILKMKFVNQMSNTGEINLLSQEYTYGQEKWRRKKHFS